MSKPGESVQKSSSGRRFFGVLVAIAVVLCLICCMFFLVIPTQSISVDTVYEGF